VIRRKIIQAQKQTARFAEFAREKKFDNDYSFFQIIGQADIPITQTAPDRAANLEPRTADKYHLGCALQFIFPQASAQASTKEQRLFIARECERS
jgi:hypothetical protein